MIHRTTLIEIPLITNEKNKIERVIVHAVQIIFIYKTEDGQIVININDEGRVEYKITEETYNWIITALGVETKQTQRIKSFGYGF